MTIECHQLRGALVVILLAVAAGCNKPRPIEEIGPGTLNGHTYSHEHFGFSMTFPEEWHVASRAEQDELVRQGRDFATSGNKQLEAAVKATESQTLSLVSGFRYPPGAFVESNPNIIVTAERVAHAPGINRGSDYLRHSQRLLSQTAMQLQFEPIENDQQVGPLTMDMMPIRTNVMGQPVNQRIYASRIGDYVLLFAITYMSDDELQSLMEILNAVQPA